MKKILALALSTLLVTPAFADQWRHGHHHYRGNGYGWVAPLVLGGVAGYMLAQPRYVTPPTQVIPPGTLPPPPYGYHYETILDVYCNCYKTVLVLN